MNNTTDTRAKRVAKRILKRLNSDLREALRELDREREPLSESAPPKTLPHRRDPE